MSFSIGIVGLPNAGKSTLFKALTRKQVDIADYPFTTVEPNVGAVAVPDKRLKKIKEALKPEKTTETIIKFVDIAGLVKGAHKGEGLGNQFLSQVRSCDAVVEVIRNFSASKDFETGQTEYQLTEKPNPKRDIEILKTEFLMKDLETIEKALEKTPQKEILLKIKEKLEQRIEIREMPFNAEEIKEYQLLTAKPIIYLFNVKGEPKKENLSLNLKIEEESGELTAEEKRDINLETQLDQLIINCYDVLELITFFTIKGGKEVRAWTIKKGSPILEAAEKVHSDFKENFIKAEVLPWEKLVEAGSFAKAREKGEIKTAGKEYIVLDGDVIEFKI